MAPLAFFWMLGRWHRERGFGPSPAGTSESAWWIARVKHDGRFEALSDTTKIS
jgi:hypothetical protein